MSAYDVADLDPDEPTLDDAAGERVSGAVQPFEGGVEVVGRELAGYPTPVTRACKPPAAGRAVDDVLPTL
jgi:hypothetical protein